MFTYDRDNLGWGQDAIKSLFGKQSSLRKWFDKDSRTPDVEKAPSAQPGTTSASTEREQKADSHVQRYEQEKLTAPQGQAR